jgi:hypothetical protein
MNLLFRELCFYWVIDDKTGLLKGGTTSLITQSKMQSTFLDTLRLFLL